MLALIIDIILPSPEKGNVHIVVARYIPLAQKFGLIF